MNQKLVEHTIVVDEHVEVTLKIPKVMNALELKSLSTKATKLFNLAEVPIVNNKTRGNGWSNQMERILYTLKTTTKLGWDDIGKKVGKTGGQCLAKTMYMKKTGKWHK